MWTQVRDKIDAWRLAADEAGRDGRVRGLEALALVLDFFHHLVVNSSLRTAASLAFTTVVSVVPMLAVSFAIFRLFVPDEATTASVTGYLVDSLLAGSVGQVRDVLQVFLGRAQGGALGAVGFLFLLVTAISLFLSVERAFNHIWHVPATRPLHRRLTAFYAVLTLTPALVGAGLLVREHLKDGVDLPLIEGFAQTAFPWAMEALALLLMYKLLPHAPVRWRSAAVGALGAALAFHLSKALFNVYVSTVFAGSVAAKIYGSFSLVPIFFLWIYVAWVIVLAGVQLAYVTQNRHLLSRALLHRRGRRNELPSPPNGYLVARIFLEIARHFQRFGGGTRPEEIARRLQIPMEEVTPALTILRTAAWVLVVENQAPSLELVPAHPLHQLMVSGIYELCGQAGYQPGELPTDQDADDLEVAVHRAARVRSEALDVSFASLLEVVED